MLNWIKSLARSNKKTLGDLLFTPEGREILLGEKRIVSLDPQSIRRDATRIVQYARSEDYQSFAKEAYLDFIDCVDQLCKPTVSGNEVDYLRGRMAQTLDLLKISYKAHKKLQERNANVTE